MKFVHLPVLLFFIIASMTIYAVDEMPAETVQPSVLDGELLLPEDYDTAKEKKCMTVCDQWGEDCIINPRTGGRKCRRVCKSFTEECF